MSEVKKHIKKSLLSLSNENAELRSKIKYMSEGLKMARAFEIERTGSNKTKYDKYLELK